MPALVDFLQLDLEVDRARGDHVLDLEVRERGRGVADLLHGSRVVLCRVQAVLLTFGSGDDHFSVFEYQGGGALGLSQRHPECWKPLRVVHCVSALEADLLQVELALQVGRRDQVLYLRWCEIGLRPWVASRVHWLLLKSRLPIQLFTIIDILGRVLYKCIASLRWLPVPVLTRQFRR